MKWIAGIALLLGGYVGLGGYPGLSTLLNVTTICETTPRGQCARNELNVVLATLEYLRETGHFPTGTWANPGLPPEKRLSWYAIILPGIDRQDERDSLDMGRSWDAPDNIPLAGIRIGVLACPQAARVLAGGPIPTHFIGIAGLGLDAPILPRDHPRAGIFGYDRQTSLKDITDGTSFTMVLAESNRVQGSWLTGGPATVRGLDPADPPYLGVRRQFGGLHQRGANVAFADGSVRFISDTVDPGIFEAFSTIAGGEALPPDLFR